MALRTAIATRPGMQITELQAELKPAVKQAQQTVTLTIEQYEALKQAASRKDKPITWGLCWEVSDGKGGRKEGKGGIKVCGLNIRFPMTAYLSQWIRLLEVVSEFTAYLASVYDQANWRTPEEQEAYRPRMAKLVQRFCKAA